MVLGRSASAWACDFSDAPVSDLYARATDVFVGTVLESPFLPDGTVAIGSDPAGGRRIRFEVRTRYKGNGVPVLVDDFSDCSFPFRKGYTYLVFGVSEGGRFATGSPWRPLQVDPRKDDFTERSLAEAQKYAVARAAGKPQSLLYGRVLLGAGKDAVPAQEADAVIVYVVRADDKRSFDVAYPNYSYGFEMAVPPGEYQVFVLRRGDVSAPSTVVVLDGEKREMSLAPGWPR